MSDFKEMVKKDKYVRRLASIHLLWWLISFFVDKLEESFSQ